MSRLYASIDADASKTQATRRAHKNMTAHIRGWDSGIKIEAYVDDNGHDCFQVSRTGGSNGAYPDVWMFTLMDGFVMEAS